VRQYVKDHLDADREVATILADLIVGGLLVTEVARQSGELLATASSSLRSARKRLGGFEAADCHPLYGPKGSRPS
jgi:hypothetical protein